MLTRHNVLSDNLYMMIAIRPRMFMPKAHHMSQLMYHDTEFVTVLANRDGLRSIAALTNKRAASYILHLI